MKTKMRVVFPLLMTALASGFALTACVGAADDEDADELTVGGGTATFEAGSLAIEEYGAAVLQNPGVSCSAANGGAGAIVVLEASTGQAVTVAGVAATARSSVSIGGGDGTSRSANGNLAIGAAALWNAAEASVDLGGLVLGHYTVDMGASMPASPADANAMFDAAFGPSARYGLSLDQQRQTTPRRGTPSTVAWYALGEQELTGPGGSSASAGIAVGIVRYDGRVLAVQTTGFGDWATYAR
jgi:hypothetical protein